MPSALQEWVQGLSIMQQSVLIASIRAHDGFPKFHKIKPLMRWYRRCILLSAFDGCELTDPYAPGGGSFTGPLGEMQTLESVTDDFIDSRDDMSLHFFAHFMHSAEILGYKHPIEHIRYEWFRVYERMANALHLWPETEEQLDSRLGDNEAGWRARNDPSSTCSD